jgi:hypothetical protein
MKKWYLSKTLWVNLIAIATVIVGDNILTADAQVAILGVVNLVLRIVTQEKLSW